MLKHSWRHFISFTYGYGVLNQWHEGFHSFAIVLAVGFPVWVLLTLEREKPRPQSRERG